MASAHSDPVGMPEHMPTTLLKVLGAVIALIGGWAALVAYAGPEFGYPMPPGSDQPAWEWSASHTWRHLLPGVVAILGGAILFARKRSVAAIGGFIALAAGAWMILSPFVVRAWLDTGGGGGGAGDVSTAMQILTPLGYHHVPGILTVGLAAFALGGMLVPARRDEALRRDERRRHPSERPAERFEREPASARQ